MASVARAGDVVRVSLDADEVAVLANLAGQVAAMLAPDADADADAGVDPLEELVGMSSAPVAAPDDPALQRLLPAAYADEHAAAEFRRLTDAELRGAKVAALGRVVADVGGGRAEVSLDGDGADVWLQALNDLRLVIGTRLDVEEDMSRRRIAPDDPRMPLFVIYDWLSLLQDQLVEAVMGVG